MPTATSTKKKNDALRRFSRFEMSPAVHRLDTRALHPEEATWIVNSPESRYVVQHPERTERRR